MGSRRQARECALQALYQCDSLNDWSNECLELYFSVFHPEIEPVPLLGLGEQDHTAQPELAKQDSFARVLVHGVVEHIASIDGSIGAASRNWSVARMSRVDRNIIRVATFEINYLTDVPPNVSINEAIEIAKRFGTDDSPMFVNGVLDKISSDFKRNQELFPAGLKKAMNS